jgi:hypothetical protein
VERRRSRHPHLQAGQSRVRQAQVSEPLNLLLAHERCLRCKAIARAKQMSDHDVPSHPIPPAESLVRGSRSGGHHRDCDPAPAGFVSEWSWRNCSLSNWNEHDGMYSPVGKHS